MNDLSNEKEKYLLSIDDKYSELDKEVESLINSIVEEHKAYNRSLIEKNTLENSTYNMLEGKRKQLESYSNKVIDLCAKQEITTANIDLDETMFTAEELNELYDDYLRYMEKEESSSGNIITDFREACSEQYIPGICLVIVLGLCFTPILNIVSIDFCVALVMNQLNKVDLLSLLIILKMVLMENFKFY